MQIRASLVAVFLCLFTVAACNHNNARANLKENVSKSLAQAGFEHDVNVDVDQNKGVVTLKGRVRSQELKDHAGQVAQTAAPGDVIANELSVEPVDEEKSARAIESNVDDAIEKNYKAALIADHLDKQHIEFHAKNGVLTLTGHVANSNMRSEAEQIGAKTPNVQSVVNKLDVGK